jgi:hypothetical protein
MQPDLELEGWRREWQAHDAIEPAIKQRVERESRQMRRGVAMEVVVSVVMAGGTLVWAAISRREDAVALAAGVWILVAIAWIASWMLKRRAWKPATETTVAFLELSMLRCRRNLHAITAQAVLYVVIVAFDTVWLYYYRAPTRGLDLPSLLVSPPYLVLWAITPVLALIAIRYRDRVRRELDNLTLLRRQLDGSA